MAKLPNEQSLIKQVKKGKISSFEKIVKHYQRAIFRHAMRILKDPDKAHDATQDTFLKTFENIQRFKKGKPLRPWIYKIATNTCYDMIKKNKRVSRLEYDIADEKESYLERLVKKEQVKRLSNALKTLPEIYKLPIMGFYFDRLSYKSLAFELNVPINTIKTRIYRGKKLLKEKLE